MKLAKSILRSINISAKHLPTDEDLLTIFKEVHAIINSRSLTSISNSPNNLATISPDTLLNGALHPNAPTDVFCESDKPKNCRRILGNMA